MSGNQKRRPSSFFILYTILVFLSFTGLAGAEVIIGISPEKTSVNEGESFTLSITIESDVNVSGAELELVFDPALVNITTIVEGSFFKQGGKSTIFSRGSIDNELGTVTGIYSVIMGNDMLLKPSTFATVTLISKNTAGITDIEMRNVVITNSAGESLQVTVKNAKVIVGDVTAVAANQDDAEKESKQSGQNSLIPLAFAMMCLYFKRK